MQLVDCCGARDGKRKKCTDNDNEVNEAQTLTYVETMYIELVNKDLTQWMYLKCIVNALPEDYETKMFKNLVECIKDRYHRFCYHLQRSNMTKD